MEVRKFGYIRVSSKDQDEGRQREAMKEICIVNRINSWTNKVGKISIESNISYLNEY